MKRENLICVILFFITGLLYAGKPGTVKISSSNDSLSENSKAYIIQISTGRAPAIPDNYNELSRFNFFGICWNGKPDDNLKFARQMGYSYVMYQDGMEKSPLAADLFFYLESPEYQVYRNLGVDREVRDNRKYTPEQIKTYQEYFALKNPAAVFPDNLATGWTVPGSFTVEPDWQQQRVIDYFVSGVEKDAAGKENKEKHFLFGGLTWDVPQFTGDFWGDGKQVSLAFWTGKDSAALAPGTIHDFRTYSAGKVAWYLKIKQRMRADYADRKLTYVFEPYNFYDSWFKDLEQLDLSNRNELMEDAFISQEAGVTRWSTGTEFVEDPRVYNASLVAKVHTGSSTPDNHHLAGNKLIAAKAAINGAWMNWYGRFSGSGDRVPMNNIYQVPNWLQLIRVVANWDNLNGIPAGNRKWDGSAYSSTNSRMDDNIIYSRQPKTQKLFVVFLNGTGEISLNPGEKIVSIKHVDAYFCETADATNELIISGNKIRLKTVSGEEKK